MGYKTHAFKGVSWMALLRVSTRGITFVRLAILARILTPTQFGVFGVATLVLAFLEIITETGINVFLVQEREIKNYINSALVVSIIRGCIVAIILILSAPFITSFFHSPDSYSVIILIAIVPFIRGFINPSIIYIQKDIKFHKEFYLRSFLFLVDAIVAVSFAFITRDVKSFAYGLIASALVEVTFSYLFFKPLPKLVVEVEKIKHIIRRGWWVNISGIFSYFADNGDNIAVGRIMATSSLGLYQVAYKISTLPISEIAEVVNKVTFPVYSKFSNDKARLARAFYKVTFVSSGISIILGLFIFIFANQIVLLIVGSSWQSIVPVVKVLALYGVLRTMFGNFAALFLSIQRQDYPAKMILVRVVALLIVILPLINTYGLVGAGYAMVISVIAEIPVTLFFFYKVFRLKK